MTTIQWTDETWNPVTGCSKVSQGCKNCYAERIWKKVYGFRPFTDVKFHEDRLKKPLSWRDPRMVFVNSMSDLFHEAVTEQQINRIFAVMGLAGQHRFQVLTKRPERMLAEMTRLSCSMTPLEDAARTMGHTFKFAGLDNRMHSLLPWPIPNVWLGVSVEDQKTADERIQFLVDTPAAIRWISAEPLLEPVNLEFWLNPGHNNVLDWVVIGGESGTKEKSRPFDLAWAYDLIRQCREAGVPVFLKQLGRNPIFSGGDGLAASHTMKFKDWHGGMIDEWPEDLRVREFPNPGSMRPDEK